MTNQALPPAIQRQLDEAEALQQQLMAAQTPETGNTEAEPPVADSEPPASPVVEEQAAQPEPKPSDAEMYKHKYDVLAGKYNAEVPRMNAQLKEANGQIQALVAEIEKLKAARQEPARATEPDNDAEVFGEDLTAAIDRRAKNMAKSMFDAEMQPLREYVKQMEAKLGVVDKQVAYTAEERFFTQLAQLVPDYREVNADQGFLTWLGETDPIYGVPRQAALNAASDVLDADRTAAIFNAYKVLTGKQMQNANKQQVRQELERQVAPTTSSTAAKPPVTGKIWSQKEYERAFDPRTIRELGMDKANELMAQADTAYAEGRVRWGA